MYNKILVALDGSIYSENAINIALKIAEYSDSSTIYGCHVYASKMHKFRFSEMESGLPERYQNSEKLNYLRDTHEDLITDGMQLISDAYLAPLVNKAVEKNLKVEGLTPEGRNYSKLLEIITRIKPDLIILGGWGHGKEEDNILGSLTQRILLHNTKSDLLIVKKPMVFKYNPIVIGIDGSLNSYSALTRALNFASIYNTSIDAIAVYDPYFHTGVFKKIADALPIEAQKKFNFTAQEKIHDEIIDKGLEKLYLEGLKKAQLIAESKNMILNINVLAGKVYKKIIEYSNLNNSDLIVLGRWGLHKEDISLIGSHVFNCSMLSKTNVLIVIPSEIKENIPELRTVDIKPIKWKPEAEKIAEKIPTFVRKMAKKMIEDYARERGFAEVIPELVEDMASKFGMEGKQISSEDIQNETHETSLDKKNILKAEQVTFHKTKRLAPNFHKNILISKIKGEILEEGQNILVYEVKKILPKSPGLVTEDTELKFI
ncbi:MAG: universal stress protein [Promethearchaeota archaeon]